MFPFDRLVQPADTTIHCSPNSVDIQTTDGPLSILDFTKKYVPAVLSRFQPAWWLPNGHAQTAYCATGNFENIDKVQYQRKYIRLPDGGTIGIDFTPSLDEPLPVDTPIIVVQHGLTGGSHESYVRNILAAACAPKDQNGLGYRAAVINFRGCAGVPVTSPRFYSGACTDDLACGALYISTLFPKAKLVGIGFSLGANIITRYLGEEGNQSRLNGGLALACPWSLAENSKHLEGNWFSRNVYSSAMGNNLLRLYKTHTATLETFKDTHLLKVHPEVLKLKSPKLIEIDHVLVSQTGGPAPIWPFPTAVEYYEYAGSDHALPGIAVPYLAISAQDDPIVRLIPRPDDPKTNASGWVAVAITERGGHLGWFEDGQTRGEVRRWVSRPALQWIRAIAEDFLREEGQGGRPIEVVDGFTREFGRPAIGFREIDENDLPKRAEAEGLTKGL